nr:hypothetical protein [Pontiella sulfatireligans]
MIRFDHSFVSLFPVRGILGRLAALIPFFPFIKLPLDLVERQPHGGLKISDGPAAFFGVRHKKPLAGHLKPNGHLEDNASVPAVHPVDHGFAPAFGKIEAPQPIRLLPHQFFDGKRLGHMEELYLQCLGRKFFRIHLIHSFPVDGYSEA